jgi:hypothetical protein
VQRDEEILPALVAGISCDGSPRALLAVVPRVPFFLRRIARRASSPVVAYFVDFAAGFVVCYLLQ